MERKSKTKINNKLLKIKPMKLLFLSIFFLGTSCFFVSSCKNNTIKTNESKEDTLYFILDSKYDFLNFFSLNLKLNNIKDRYPKAIINYKQTKVNYGNGETKIDSIISIKINNSIMSYYCSSSELTIIDSKISDSSFILGSDISIGMKKEDFINKIPKMPKSASNDIYISDISELIQIHFYFRNNILKSITIYNNEGPVIE